MVLHPRVQKVTVAVVVNRENRHLSQLTLHSYVHLKLGKKSIIKTVFSHLQRVFYLMLKLEEFSTFSFHAHRATSIFFSAAKQKF